MLRAGLTQYGYQYFEAPDGKSGIEVYKQNKPDLVLTDVKMPEMSGIELTKQIKGIEQDADVVIMTGYGSEELVVEALRSGASNYVKKPVSLNELFNILDSLILKRERRKKSVVIKDVVTHEQKNLIIDNDITRIWGVINQILFNIPENVPESMIEGMRLGLYEIILNSIEHGNLGISYEEKSQALQNNSYLNLLANRSNEQSRRDTKVFINCTYNREVFEIEITDQGEGFDYKMLANMEDQDRMLRAHGRGIFLASLYFDKLKYEDPGNKVELFKKIEV
jgi:CheY-like chemotaxis protein/anti-sigma regulatory factor (Ser/Thr protein kinase)